MFAANRDRFHFADAKIRYKRIYLPDLEAGQDPFDLERIQRVEMDAFIHSLHLNTNDRIIMADVDEIPSLHTLQLLKKCNSPNIHLQLRNYLYSFEFQIDFESWRSKVVRHPFPYSHSRATDLILADSGWHCSFCFRTINEFVFKMRAYSHADRVHSERFLDHHRIQEIICKGSDIYDLVPEVHSYKEMFIKWDPVKSASAIGLPWYVVKEFRKFNFLLPGGCLRPPET